ncbi:MAG: hypothetical protein SH850_16835 [Planctomycetaceae bacterium]|nr:hypothetical protein [Planctomycetaceae bacterium]
MTKVPTPFATRLLAVWLSLRTRWLYGLFLYAFAIGMSGFALEIVRQRDQPPRLVHVLSFASGLKPNYTVGVRNVTSNDVAPVAARSLTAYTPLSDWRTSDQIATLPNLESVEMFTPASGDDLAWLATQPKLSSQSLLMTQNLLAVDLSRLSASQSLRHLRVLEAAGYRTEDAVAWPPNLEVLDLMGAHELPVRRLEELSRLPKLHTLAVRLNPRHPSSKLPEDAIAALTSFPALRNLYLLEMSHLYPDLASEAQRALPGLRVRPSTYDANRVSRLTAMCLVVSVWAAAVAVMLSPQFVAPQSLLLPGYRAPHVWMAVLILATGLAVVIGLLLVAGTDLLTALGLCGGTLTFVGLMIAFLGRIEPGLPGFTQPLMALPVFVFTVPVLMGFLWLSPGEVDWFLRGEKPWLSETLLVTGLVLTWDSGRWLTSLYRGVETAGRGGCPMAMLDFGGWKTWSLTINQSKRPSSWRYLLTGSEQRFDAVTSEPLHRAADRRRLWDAGTEITSRRAGLFMVLVSLVVFAGIFAWGNFVSGVEFEPEMLVGGLAYAAVMTIYLPAMFTYGRLPFFPMEVLRPVSRADWVADWFTMTAYDLLTPMAASVVASVLAAWLKQSSLPAIPYWPPICLLFCGVWLSIWGAELWLLTYRWAGIAVVVALLNMAGGMFAMSVSSSRFGWEAWMNSLPGVWTFAVASVLLGGCLLLGARRRWLTWELGA